MNDVKRMSSLSVGESAAVRALVAEGSIRRRFVELGMVSGARVICVGISPLGDPCAYLIRDKIIAIRKRDASGVVID